MNERVKEWMHEWMNEGMNESTNERMDEWMNERVNERSVYWLVFERFKWEVIFVVIKIGFENLVNKLMGFTHVFESILSAICCGYLWIYVEAVLFQIVICWIKRLWIDFERVLMKSELFWWLKWGLKIWLKWLVLLMFLKLVKSAMFCWGPCFLRFFMSCFKVFWKKMDNSVYPVKGLNKACQTMLLQTLLDFLL